MLSHTTNNRCNILCCHFVKDCNAFWCNITCLVAILNALIDCRLRLDYQVTIIYLVLMDSLIPKTMV